MSPSSRRPFFGDGCVHAKARFRPVRLFPKSGFFLLINYRLCRLENVNDDLLFKKTIFCLNMFRAKKSFKNQIIAGRNVPVYGT